jgi:hypothetical protein
MCLGSASSSCSTIGTLRIALVTNPVICDELGNDRDVRTTSGTFPWSLVTQIFRNGAVYQLYAGREQARYCLLTI